MRWLPGTRILTEVDGTGSRPAYRPRLLRCGVDGTVVARVPTGGSPVATALPPHCRLLPARLGASHSPGRCASHGHGGDDNDHQHGARYRCYTTISRTILTVGALLHVVSCYATTGGGGAGGPPTRSDHLEPSGRGWALDGTTPDARRDGGVVAAVPRGLHGGRRPIDVRRRRYGRLPRGRASGGRVPGHGRPTPGARPAVVRPRAGRSRRATRRFLPLRTRCWREGPRVAPPRRPGTGLDRAHPGDRRGSARDRPSRDAAARGRVRCRRRRAVPAVGDTERDPRPLGRGERPPPPCARRRPPAMDARAEAGQPEGDGARAPPPATRLATTGAPVRGAPPGSA